MHGGAQVIPKKYSGDLKFLRLGMPKAPTFFFNNYQFVLVGSIFLLIQMLCAILGAILLVDH